MDDPTIVTITIHATPEGFYCNASVPGPEGQPENRSFVCNTVQPTADMALASAIPHIRRYTDITRNRTLRNARLIRQAAEVREGPVVTLALGTEPELTQQEEDERAFQAELRWEERTRRANY